MSDIRSTNWQLGIHSQSGNRDNNVAARTDPIAKFEVGNQGILFEQKVHIASFASYFPYPSLLVFEAFWRF
jgi:hypothetical protein